MRKVVSLKANKLGDEVDISALFVLAMEGLL
jgi:hypothetical protein